MAPRPRERSWAWAARSVTCRNELRTMPVLACRMAFPAFSLIAFNSARLTWMVRWFRSSSFSRSASSGAISATTFRWAWVSLTGKCCGTAGILSPLVLDLFLVDGEACLQVVRQGSRVVLGAGMEPEAPGAVAPRLVDGPLEEMPPQALADEFRHQAELHQFDLAFHTPVQLGKASRDAIGHQDVDFQRGVV